MTEPRYRVYLCGGATCSANGQAALLRALEQALWDYELDGLVELRVSSCQDRCAFGPNLKVWPGPFHYARLTPTAIRQIVAQHLRDGQPVAEWLGNESMRRQ